MTPGTVIRFAKVTTRSAEATTPTPRGGVDGVDDESRDDSVASKAESSAGGVDARLGSSGSPRRHGDVRVVAVARLRVIPRQEEAVVAVDDPGNGLQRDVERLLELVLAHRVGGRKLLLPRP